MDENQTCQEETIKSKKPGKTEEHLLRALNNANERRAETQKMYISYLEGLIEKLIKNK